MPRLRNVRTGSVVNVDDVTAARLGVEYRPVDPTHTSNEHTEWPTAQTPVKAEPRRSRRKPAKTDDDE